MKLTRILRTVACGFAVTIAFGGEVQAQENVGTVRQPLVGGSVLDLDNREEFGLISLSVKTSATTVGLCSGSLLRNNWVITAAHCVEIGGGIQPVPDPTRPGQNLLLPIAGIKVTANWKTVSTTSAVQVATFRPYDIALIKVANPFPMNGTTSGYQRLIFQDGQFPDFGEPVGADLLVFGQGINVFAKGQGATATPSSNDQTYRIGYAKPTRDDARLYWYPSSGSQSIAGGDSGGPSFAFVLSGYALVGVHALAKVQFVPGKPKTGWTWVTATPEAADAPIAPVIPQLMALMGPAPPDNPDGDGYRAPNEFIGTFGSTPPDYQPIWLYGIEPNGDLMWYRKDTNASAWQGPKKVGSGWNQFKDVIAAGGNRFYALTKDGKLLWYQHDGFNDGTFAWKHTQVGNGWSFARIFAGGDGVIYAIRKDGKLFWYRNTGFQDGTNSWMKAVEVGSGWNHMQDVFSTGNGAVYAVKADGTLLFYQEKNFTSGGAAWYPARAVGSGWNRFMQIIPAGSGIILAITPDGKLLWYKHQATPAAGAKLAKDTWQGPVQIGTGWEDFGKVIAVMPEAAPPPVH